MYPPGLYTSYLINQKTRRTHLVERGCRVKALISPYRLLGCALDALATVVLVILVIVLIHGAIKAS